MKTHYKLLFVLLIISGFSCRKLDDFRIVNSSIQLNNNLISDSRIIEFSDQNNLFYNTIVYDKSFYIPNIDTNYIYLFDVRNNVNSIISESCSYFDSNIGSKESVINNPFGISLSFDIGKESSFLCYSKIDSLTSSAEYIFGYEVSYLQEVVNLSSNFTYSHDLGKAFPLCNDIIAFANDESLIRIFDFTGDNISEIFSKTIDISRVSNMYSYNNEYIIAGIGGDYMTKFDSDLNIVWENNKLYASNLVFVEDKIFKFSSGFIYKISLENGGIVDSLNYSASFSEYFGDEDVSYNPSGDLLFHEGKIYMIGRLKIEGISVSNALLIQYDLLSKQFNHYTFTHSDNQSNSFSFAYIDNGILHCLGLTRKLLVQSYFVDTNTDDTIFPNINSDIWYVQINLDDL